MKIHEYQAKQILREYGVPTPDNIVAVTADEAVAAGQKLGYPCVVKAQVHVGGRGLAGGVKLAKSEAEVKAAAEAIIGMDIKGITVRQVIVEAGVDIQTEIYLGMVIDRKEKFPVFIASAAGGVDIETVAAETPEKILTLAVPTHLGLKSYQIRQMAEFLELPKEAMKPFGKMCSSLFTAFMDKDCSLAEINPLVITGAGEVVACDAKMNFDDNALPWHKDIEALRDDNEEEPLEVEARKQNLNYVKLDGQIGCLVNGAGLAMCTMDVIKHYGGSPANFCDIGGGAKSEQVIEALRIITSDPSVNTIFFNIFGGIVRCDMVAEGILKAQETLQLKIPIVIRLTGTNEDKAKEMLEGTDLIYQPTMADGAQKAVELSKRS